MSSHLVEGIALPDAVAGHPALEFCNTRAGWGSAEPKEYLVSWRALLLWTLDARLLGPDDVSRLLVVPSRSGEAELHRATRLRDAVYRAALNGATSQDWALVTRETAGARSRSTLRPTRGGPAAWVVRTDLPFAAVDAIAGTVEDLLTSPTAGSVGVCPGEGCGWLFVDPRHRRRWCSMAVCGNRAKARRFAAGRRLGQPSVNGPRGDGPPR